MGQTAVWAEESDLWVTLKKGADRTRMCGSRLQEGLLYGRKETWLRSTVSQALSLITCKLVYEEDLDSSQNQKVERNFCQIALPLTNGIYCMRGTEFLVI